jgi:hypothetical protein
LVFADFPIGRSRGFLNNAPLGHANGLSKTVMPLGLPAVEKDFDSI